MSTADVLRHHLETSANALIWAVEQMPTGRLYTLPPVVFGAFSVAQIVFYLTWLERHIALPHMRLWQDGEIDPAQMTTTRFEADWRARRADIPELVADFRVVRGEILALLHTFDNAALQVVRSDTIWEVPVSLQWVVARTYQQTLEHTDTLMKMVLYWDMQGGSKKDT
ncbi:MAG: hypothetical protein OHK0046_26930 [Anaerolineae bacterium]